MIDRILVVDDEFLTRELLEEIIQRQGIEVVSAASGEEAIEVLEKNDCQMIFSDLKMGRMSGIDLLGEVRRQYPHIAMVIVTAYGSVETAVEAMRLGAFDFILKPFNPDQVEVLVEKARNWLQMSERQHYLQGELTGAASPGRDKRIVGASPEMERVMQLVRRVAPTQATVLITGESGTGKELIANEIHRLSDPDGKRPYIRMNCAAVPETLLESELFGHEKGAFTGATDRRIGRFELADGGTLLLDEIGEINIGMQAKLLRVLQESEFERVGGGKTIRVNVRVIATTNRDLETEVEEGNFRGDLYYRLNVFPIEMRPLRERGEDVALLASTFLARQAKRLRRPLEWTDAAVDCLCRYPWPGNIRELENVVERIAILADGPAVDVDNLPPELTRRSPTGLAASVAVAPTVFNLREIERNTIVRALEKTNGNRTRAAELLGFSVRTLRNKLNELREENAPELAAIEV